MPQPSGRDAALAAATLAEGWSLERLTPASRLFGANGLATGADGRLYVAQVAGSQVSAIDVDSGAIEVVSPMGGDIVAPDDLVFDEAGNLYLTEITEGRVCMRSPGGQVRVIQGDMPVANPITWHQGRLIAGECRFGARIMELDRNGGAPRVILEDVPMANAFQVGPDGKLYFPAQGANQIWRVSLDGGAPEVVAGDLGVPDSVKFDSKGRIVTTQVASGQVLRIDLQSGAREILADLGPGLDNVAFVGERMFVSSIPGEITEILEGGRIRPIAARGLQWPMGLAVGDDGALFVADGGFAYTLRPGGRLELAGMLFSPGFPGFVRGVAAAGEGRWVVSTALGTVARWRAGAPEHEVLASGLAMPMGVAVRDDAVAVADGGAGRVLLIENGGQSELASGLDSPTGLAFGADGACYVAESGAGRILALAGGRTETVLDGLGRPEGLAAWGNGLVTVDLATRELIAFAPDGSGRRTLASGLPVGAPGGLVRVPAGGVGDMCGPMTAFTGLAAGGDGTIYLSADAEGSVLALRPH
ncbi:MAG: gluconolaconase [Novosphingobium sp.]